jgi:two-component system, NarL family, nitrate/nitrite response regulator NarL
MRNYPLRMSEDRLDGIRGADVASAFALDGRLAPPRPPSPLIVEEKPICRLAMADALQGMGVRAEPVFAANLPQALEVAVRVEAPLALVDLFSIEYNFEGLRRLVIESSAPVVAIDDRPNPTFAQLAQRAGAQGYASKSFEIEQFRGVIRAVMEGGAHFPRGVQAGRAAGDPRSPAGLSPRQIQVLKCIAVGMSNQEIARSLGITPGTVKLHIHAILRATGTRNRTEVALIAGRFLAPGVEPEPADDL